MGEPLPLATFTPLCWTFSGSATMWCCLVPNWRDIAMLLLAFPDLKVDPGPVTQQLAAAHAPAEILAVWQGLVQQAIQPAEDDDDF